MGSTSYLRRQFRIAAILIAVLAVLVTWAWWGNTTIVTTNYTVSSSRLPSSFNGFKIVQISDLHNAEFGDDNEKLLAKVRQADPDIIVLTGDLIDSHKTRVDVAVRLAQNAQEIAPTYFITGNHEAVARDADQQLEEALNKARVTTLHNENAQIQRGSDTIAIAGIDDPSYVSSASLLDNRLNTAIQPDTYNVLLAHHPEELATYAQYGADLVLSGHAHGGQIRLPFIGGLIAPDQGFFPEFDAGEYQDGDTTLILSRGLGNSIVPLRINNRPELVVVTLETA